MLTLEEIPEVLYRPTDPDGTQIPDNQGVGIVSSLILLPAHLEMMQWRYQHLPVAEIHQIERRNVNALFQTADAWHRVARQHIFARPEASDRFSEFAEAMEELYRRVEPSIDIRIEGREEAHRETVLEGITNAYRALYQVAGVLDHEFLHPTMLTDSFTWRMP